MMMFEFANMKTALASYVDEGELELCGRLQRMAIEISRRFLRSVFSSIVDRLKSIEWMADAKLIVINRELIKKRNLASNTNRHIVDRPR